MKIDFLFRKDVIWSLIVLQFLLVFGQLRVIFSSEDQLPNSAELEYLGDFESCQELMNPIGCYNLGVHFYNLKQNAQAEIYFQRACHERHIQSCTLLAEEKLKQNMNADAFYWALKATSFGESPASAQILLEMEPLIEISIRQNLRARVQAEAAKSLEPKKTLEEKAPIPEVIPETIPEATPVPETSQPPSESVPPQEIPSEEQVPPPVLSPESNEYGEPTQTPAEPSEPVEPPPAPEVTPDSTQTPEALTPPSLPSDPSGSGESVPKDEGEFPDDFNFDSP